MSGGAIYDAWRAQVEAGALDHDPAQARAVQALDDLARRLQRSGGGLFRKPKRVDGLWLHGPVGTGKSMLMSLFFEKAPVEAKRRLHFHDFMAGVHEALEAERKAGKSGGVKTVARAMARDARLFCLDEAEITDIADAMIVGRFFGELFARGATLVCTSNRMPSELYEHGINRQLFEPFIDLIHDHLDIIQLDAGRDYRRQALAGEDLWLSPLGEGTRQRFDRLWARATGEAAPHEDHLHVKGRTLTVKRAAAGCARMEFETLCGQPRGAADYGALGRRYRVLFIDNVPKLGPERRDAAKRFVTLIDALYESETVLAATAEAEPEQLYERGDYAYEFRRAASRIAELRRADIAKAG